jgi:hypothetical protein
MKFSRIFLGVLIGLTLVFVYELYHSTSSTPGFKYSVNDTICLNAPQFPGVKFKAKIVAKFDSDEAPSHLYVLDFSVPTSGLEITLEQTIDQYKVDCE